ncbi:hypothetical protein [Phenylobacterium sp.]|nr:hypothetical protein [Phenylobacterium sp.]HLZ76002.1 hypothetical protein [Phenylobacterium sp.]
MNDPFLGLAVYSGAIFVFAIGMTLFIGHKRRRIAEEIEAEREAAAHPAS